MTARINPDFKAERTLLTPRNHVGRPNSDSPMAAGARVFLRCSRQALDTKSARTALHLARH